MGLVVEDDKILILGIHEFQNGILNGQYSDAKGKAEIIINGATYNTYSVHIDRRIVSSAGSVVSFSALLKEHGAENIKIRYTKKRIEFPDLDEYISYTNTKH